MAALTASGFDWSQAVAALNGFGGKAIALHVRKTGLPFFDALRLYGAIDLYIGVREDVYICDEGSRWRVEGRRRLWRTMGRDKAALDLVRKNIDPKMKGSVSTSTYCEALAESLQSGEDLGGQDDSLHRANKAFARFDSAIQSGIRGVAASSYHTMESGQSTAKECIAQLRLSHGLLAFAGKVRTEAVGDIVFLPIFEGQIDLSKVVSPVRAWVAVPNLLCAEALMLLALKTSLFAEGYQDRLSAVVYNRQVRRGDFAYSGNIAIASTAIGKIKSSDFAAVLHGVFRRAVRKAWQNKKATEFTPHAIAMANWLMQPTARNLSGLITSQEKLKAAGTEQIFTLSDHVREVFEMAYGQWHGDSESVHKFARAVASAIYYARMKDADDPAKRWYDEVATLRSSPNPKAFINRSLNLIEIGHRGNTFVGSEESHRFEPDSVLQLIGDEFETFRDLFRMYLVQESRPPKQSRSGSEAETAPGVVETEIPLSEDEDSGEVKE